MFANGLISAPPSELTLTTAAFLSLANHNVDIVTIFCFALFRNILGTYILYFIGYRYKDKILTLLANYLTGKGEFFLVIINQLLAHTKQGNTLWVFYTRFIPTIRSIGSLPAGMSKIYFMRFLVLTTLGCIIWNIFWLLVGMFMYDLYVQFGWIVLPFSFILILLVIYIAKRKILSV